MGTTGAHIDRIQRLARRHKQAIALRSTETDIRAILGQPNHPDALTAWRDDLHSWSRTRPDVSIQIAANPVRSGGCSRSWNIQLNESLSITNRRAVDIPDFDLATRSGVRNVKLLVIGREANAVGTSDVFSDFRNLPGLAIDAIYRFP